MSKETFVVYAMAAVALLQGVLYLKFAISASAQSTPCDAPEQEGAVSDRCRVERADDNRERLSPMARYAVSALGFVMAGALLAHLVTPAVAYALLCLAMVGRCVADQIVEERVPRRRSAMLGRSRSIDPVLLIWIVLTAASAFELTPWLLEPAYRIAAVIVAVCVLIMVVVAWRIASAPPLLFGNDLAAEQVVDRETRTLRTGNACFLAIATVAIFDAFVGGQQGFIDHRFTIWGLLLLCAALFVWKRIYARHLTRSPLTS